MQRPGRSGLKVGTLSFQVFTPNVLLAIPRQIHILSKYFKDMFDAELSEIQTWRDFNLT